MKKPITLIGLATLLVLLLALFATAQTSPADRAQNTVSYEKGAKRGFGPGMGHGPGRGMRGKGMHKFWKDPDLVEALGLTEEQLTALDELDWKYREKAVELHGDLEKAQLALEKAMMDATDEAAVKKAAKDVSNLHEKMFMLQVDHQLEIRKILTEEQWKKIQAMPRGPRKGRGQGPRMRGQGSGVRGQ